MKIQVFHTIQRARGATPFIVAKNEVFDALEEEAAHLIANGFAKAIDEPEPEPEAVPEPEPVPESVKGGKAANLDL